MRVISRLDIKGPNVVKGIHLEGLRVIGNPAALARKYFEQGADELIAMDIVASLYQRSPDFNLMRSIASELFIPLTVGGGIQSLHDINNFLRAGADKVAINSHAIRNLNLLPEAVRQFGSQCIVLSVEAKRRPGGGWEAYTDGGREHSGLDAVEWIKRALYMGVGEVLLTSVDFDGTRKGYDLELLSAVTAFAGVPVVIHGGARDAESLVQAIEKGRADAVSMASILHDDEWTIEALKQGLHAKNIPIRHSPQP
ncbi:MAG: imidazole glycerol phosphate synthase cyclase subunit [Candidatus Peribacteraceae bacterium]|nr:imidazole glycerol phosphate synthase cyclase subunit [Candidatus Peribacteraceae bacterium]MDD5741912.1 imidazole glycerol phosphate synthase cyclase subunit [Candidatus Peribacteraceae bacterium]